jgi:hypothetical protein
MREKIGKEVDLVVKKLMVARNLPLGEVVPLAKEAMKRVLGEFF